MMARTLYVRDGYPVGRMVGNIIDTWERSTTLERSRGAAWYSDAHDHAASISSILGTDDIRVGAGVIAILSPQVEWSINLEEAYRLALDVADTGMTDDNTYRAFRRNVWRAWHAATEHDHIDEIVSGPKVSAFYRAIAGLSGGPVVDRHATRVATGHTFDAVTPRTFHDVQCAYLDAAEALGIDVHTLQATAWLTCKRDLRSTVGQLVWDWEATHGCVQA